MYPFDHKYPGTDLHEIDLAYILNQIKEVKLTLKDLADVNTLHYANPLDWNITTQYASMTIVRDGDTDVLYLSRQAVPAGVLLTDSEYWQRIGVYSGDSGQFRQAICSKDMGSTGTASSAVAVNEYFWYRDQLYKATAAITSGAEIVPGTNCVLASVCDDIDDIPTLRQLIHRKQPTVPQRKWIFLFDSYGVTIGSNKGMAAWIADLMGLDSSNSYIAAQSSTRFGPNYPDIGNSYQNLLAAYNSDIPKRDITDIVVCTAGNDISEEDATLQAAIQAFAAYAKAEFVNAKISVCFELWSQVHSSREAKYNCMVKMKNYVTDTPGMNWIEDVCEACKDYSLARNSTHPDGTGLYYFAQAVKNGVLNMATQPEPHGKRARFTESNSADVTAWPSNDGFQSFQLHHTCYIRTTGTNRFDVNPIEVPAAGSYNANWQWGKAIDLGSLDTSRFFGQPITTIHYPVINAAVRFASLDGHNNVWRNCQRAFLTFEDVNDNDGWHLHAKLTFYLENPGGADLAEPLSITGVQFRDNDWYTPAMYV